MDLKEVKPIIDLLTQSEERLGKKMDEVHYDVLRTKEQVTKINGRLRQVEGKTIALETNCVARKEIVQGELNELRPTARTIKFVNKLLSKPKSTLFIALGVIVGIQVLVMEAIKRSWLAEIISLIKP